MDYYNILKPVVGIDKDYYYKLVVAQEYNNSHLALLEVAHIVLAVVDTDYKLALLQFDYHWKSTQKG